MWIGVTLSLGLRGQSDDRLALVPSLSDAQARRRRALRAELP